MHPTFMPSPYHYESLNDRLKRPKGNRSVARNLLRGIKEGVWGQKSPSGVQGIARWGSEAKPPEAGDTC